MEKVRGIPSHQLKSMYEKINILKAVAGELYRESGNFPAIEKNADRILAGVKMMELGLGDIMALDMVDRPLGRGGHGGAPGVGRLPMCPHPR